MDNRHTLATNCYLCTCPPDNQNIVACIGYNTHTGTVCMHYRFHNAHYYKQRKSNMFHKLPNLIPMSYQKHNQFQHRMFHLLWLWPDGALPVLRTSQSTHTSSNSLTTAVWIFITFQCTFIYPFRLYYLLPFSLPHFRRPPMPTARTRPPPRFGGPLTTTTPSTLGCRRTHPGRSCLAPSRCSRDSPRTLGLTSRSCTSQPRTPCKRPLGVRTQHCTGTL